MQSFKTYFADKNFRLTFLGSAILLLASLVVQYYASIYVTRSISEPVTDIILSNTRVWDVEIIFIWGPILLTAIGIFVGLRRINCAPFIMEGLAIFTLIRSFLSA